MDLSRDDNILGDAIVTTTLEAVVDWGRQSSLWPFVFGTACCAIEFMATAASRYDISRFGAEVLRFSPRHADLLLVAGTISYKQAPNQKPTPKISTGPTKVDNSAPLSTSDVAKASGSVNQSVNDLQKFTNVWCEKNKTTDKKILM